jgi:acetoin utilization deacetylase AcuC-like enzyme
VDWDVHHGNGTQQSFYGDPSVLFFSTHQYPHYPGTGRASERGEGPAEGLTINVPMVPGQGDGEYREVFERILVPAADKFQPDFVVISAGFDAHRDDPLASMTLTEQGYGALTGIVMGIARRHCRGRVLSCLEGGYNLDALARSVEYHLMALLEER